MKIMEENVPQQKCLCLVRLPLIHLILSMQDTLNANYLYTVLIKAALW